MERTGSGPRRTRAIVTGTPMAMIGVLRYGVTCAAAAALIGAIVARTQAQTASQATPATQPAAAARTTAAGVYTAEQAERGAQVFSNNCVGCHAKDTYTATAFRTSWHGKPVADLFSFLSETMPEDFPGALAPKDYADVVAFMLQLNRAPTGEQELPTDVARLKTITLDLGGS